MDIIVDDTGSGSLAPNVVVDSSNIADEFISLFGRGEIEVVFSDGGGGSTVSSLKELLDVASANLDSAANKYVLTYDAPQDRFIFVNPDDVIDSAVGVAASTAYTPNMAWWDGLTGVLTLRIPNHGFGNGHYVKIADNSLTFTCNEDSHATQHTYPRPSDYASGRWLSIHNVATDTFRVTAVESAPSTNTTAHTFISAVTGSVTHSSDPRPIGLGTATLDYLDDYLDDKIDVDAGNF